MAKKRRKIKKISRVPARVASATYWPDRLDYVKAVAARGMTDTEMAEFLGVSPTLLDSWKVYYPLFNKAIEEGRSRADLEVIAALHKNAVGYDYTTDEVVRTRRGAQVVTVQKHMPAETNAQKFWLSNRNPSHWNVPSQVSLGGRGRENPIHVSAETKAMVIHSILNLITPRPDNAVEQ